MNGLIPDQFNEMYSESNTIHSHGTRTATTDYLFIEKTNLTAGQKVNISVRLKTLLWNEIPFDIDVGVFVFKAMNGLIPDQFNEMYSESNTIHSHGTRTATTDYLFIEKN